MATLTDTRVLLPIDVTHPTEDIAERLEQIMPLDGLQTHILSVQELLPSYEGLLSSVADFPEDASNQFTVKARKVLDTLGETLTKKGAKVTTEQVSGPAAAMIEKVVKDENFHITALSPGSHSRVETFFLGSTTGRVAKHVAGTILVLRNGPTSGPLEQVVFGLDGSEKAKNAMIQAVKLFKLKERSVKITIVSVVFVPTALTFISPVEFVAAINSNANIACETILADAEKTLSDLGIAIENMEIMLRHGDPSNELLQAAKATRAGLLVIGAQGHAAVQHFLLGSVAQRAVMHAPCPVAIVKS
ncbi:MAG: universal stress protein [Leptolyngbya sp.]|nr:universal stress protein [Candidatus Melainabacteria bacterium]